MGGNEHHFRKETVKRGNLEEIPANTEIKLTS
jgi:hypothetical protein